MEDASPTTAVEVRHDDLQLIIGKLRDIYDVVDTSIPPAMQDALDRLDAAVGAAMPD